MNRAQVVELEEEAEELAGGWEFVACGSVPLTGAELTGVVS